MPKSKSRTAQRSTNGDKIIDYTLAYKLQNNNIRLQKADRLRFKEFIEILSKSSTEIKEWKDKWFKFYADNQSQITDYETVWDLFAASISSVDEYIDQLDLSIEKLQIARELIAKPDNRQTLEFKVNQARADLDKLEKEVNELNKDRENLETKIHRLKNGSPNNFLQCINSQTRCEHFIKSQTSIDASIINKTKSLERKKGSFHKKQLELYKESKQTELKRCQQLKKQSIAFLGALNIETDEFNRLSKDYNHKTDFNQWEQEILHQNGSYSVKSRSNENETASDDSEHDC